RAAAARPLSALACGPSSRERKLPGGPTRGLVLSACLLVLPALLLSAPPARTFEETVLAHEAGSGPGRPLVLVDHGRARLGYRIIHGEEYGRVTLPAGRPLTIQTSGAGICLVEFMPPSPRRRAFRL